MGGAAELAILATDLDALEAAFARRGLHHWLDLRSLILGYSEQETYDGDWKTFLEVYGDCYHVPAYHGGLSSYADCNTLEWSFGAGYHAQFVDLSKRRGAASVNYAAWVDGLDAYYRSRCEPTPTLAVAWTSIYPNVMVEFYNGMVVVSIIVAAGPNRYHNRVHYLFPPDLEARVPGLTAIIKAAYDETAVEDRLLNESRARGLAMANSLGLDRATYVANLSGPAPEAGTQHFHAWWQRRFAQAG